MTDADLAAIEARAKVALKDRARLDGDPERLEPGGHAYWLECYSIEVPALVAEVRRLRAALAAEREACAGVAEAAP